MYWHKKKIHYDILIPPLNKPFVDFTKKEAEDYFEWFLSQIKFRVVYLQDYSGIELDYSIDSLDDIWGWFLKSAETEKTPVKKIREIREQLKNLPKEISEDIVREQSKHFSLETEYIIRDIAIYFGEVITRNNIAISWGYHTNIKQDSFANMPLLVGFEDRDFTPPFKTHFEPIFMVRTLACNIFDGDQKRADLRHLYEKWQRMIGTEEQTLEI